MPAIAHSLNLWIADTNDVQTEMSVAKAATQQQTADLDTAVVDTFTVQISLDSFLGPAYRIPLDAAVAEALSLTVGLDNILGPACFAALDVRTGADGLELPAQLDTAVAGTLTSSADLDALTAESRSLTTCLCVPVAETEELWACLSVNAECPGVSQLRVLPADVLIAETRNVCTLALTVLIDTGVGLQAALDLLVQAEQERFVVLEANVKSATLQVGASATYNPDGDEIEALLFVQDNGALHPEWIETMTATLLYRGEHDLGSVTFDCNNATGDGDVQALWIHPAHVDNLTVRFSGTVENCGEVTFDVAVSDEPSTTTFAPQVLEGIDLVAPRTEYTPFGSTTEVLDPAPEEIDVVNDAVVLTLLAIDFISENEPLDTGNGPIDYSGGGNRLLPSLNNDGTFVFQAVNLLPHSIDAYTVVEGAGTNLLANTAFATPTSTSNAVPQGYTLASSSTVTTLPELVETGDVNALKIRAFGSGPYVGPKSMTFASDGTVAVTAGQPITWSVLARIDYPQRTALDIPLAVVKLDTLRLTVSFRDAGDVEISQQLATFNPADVTGANYIMLQNAVPAPPIGTVGVRVSVYLESIEESDDISLYLMAPQVELSASATSRIVGAVPVTRAADVLRVPQAGNLELATGSIQIDFASSYPGTPATDSCLFDTRTGGQNGLALYHLANGKLRFVVAGPSSSVDLDTPDAYSLGAGQAQSVTVSWGSALRSIWVNGNEAVESTDTVVLPGLSGPWIYLMGDESGTSRFDGVLTAFEVQREPQQ